MRIILTTVMSLFILTCSFAQGVPQLFNYQGVARDKDNKPLANQPISVTFSLTQNSAEIWKESASFTTSPLGIFTHSIGSKTLFSTTTTPIDWTKTTILKVEIDGTSTEQQLLSVPYALVAGRALNGGTGVTYTAGSGITINTSNQIINTGDLSSSNEIQMLSIAGDKISLSNGGGTINLPPNSGTDAQTLSLNGVNLSISNGNSVTLPIGGVQTISLPINSNILTLSGNGSTADLSKYLQSLSFDTTSRLLSISGVIGSVLIPKGSGGSSGDNWGTQTATADNITLTGNGTANNPLTIKDGGVTAVKFNSMNATTGQVLKWDGTKWKPDIDSVGRSGTGGDNWGTQTATADNTTLAGNGTANNPLSIKNAGITADKLNSMNATTGYVLKWNGTAWAPALDEKGSGGLILPYKGANPSTTQRGFEVTSAAEDAISGTNSGIKKSGVSGFCEGFGEGYGVYGETKKNTGVGVFGAYFQTNKWGEIGRFDLAARFNGGVEVISGSDSKGLYVKNVANDRILTAIESDEAGGNGAGSIITNNKLNQTLVYLSKSGDKAGRLDIKGQPANLNIRDPSKEVNVVSISKNLEETDVNNNNGYISVLANGVANVKIFGKPSDGKGYIQLNGAFVVASDKRLKKNITTLSSILPTLMQLSPVSYEMLSQKQEDKTQSIGFIAQEVKKLFPQLVHNLDHEKEDGLLGLNYLGFGVLAIQAIQEQQKEIDLLKNDISYFKKENHEKGVTALKNGEIFIPLNNEYDPTTITVSLTPQYWDTFGLAVVEKTSKGIRVKELKGGKGNFAFDWEVKGVRKGYENFQVIQDKN